MSMPAADLLSAFGESILLLDRSRCVVSAVGDTKSTLSTTPGALTGASWSDLIQESGEAAEALYWVVEAAFEGWVAPQFVPTQLPFKPGLVIQPVMRDDGCLAMRIRPGQYTALDSMISGELRPLLTSVTGFADVILKGIGGPLTDIQLEDMTVIHHDAQFALGLLDDARGQWIMPGLAGPLPILAKQLLHISVDDLPQRRFASQGLNIQLTVPPDVVVYSNGMIRNALLDLIKMLPQVVKKQSTIRVEAHVVGDVPEVRLVYRAADHTMMTAQRIDPVDLFERRTIKHQARLKTIVASLHAQLSPYGCTAWALPMESLSLATIVTTVPLWHGPTERG